VINEATLEARIDQVLRTVFGGFTEMGIQHQRSFSIRFGHHEVTVDLEEPSQRPTRAIFDILLTLEGKNVVLLELKREGLDITTEDIDQGISYARLTHPITPLTLISNGSKNLFFNTYTKEKIDTEQINLNLIQRVTDSSFALALNDFKQAVSTLLNNDPSIFAKVINGITAMKFDLMKGAIGDFGKPICDQFLIQRELLKKIDVNVLAGSPLIGILGHAFSGKTIILYEYFQFKRSAHDFLLYIDGADHNYSIFQQLANHFSEQTKLQVTRDKVREWLSRSLTSGQQARFYLLVDNFNDEIPEAIKEEIIELIDIFNGINHCTIYTVDEYNYKQITFLRNRRQKSIIGQKSKILQIEELNDQEYNEARDLLFKNFFTSIQVGGHHTPEYREPRILRRMAEIYGSDMEDGKYHRIIAVPDVDHLYTFAGNKIYTEEVKELYLKIATCFIHEHEIRKNNTDLQIAASGNGAISAEGFKKHFPDDYAQLTQSSFIILRRFRDGSLVIFPKIPELLAKCLIKAISNQIVNLSKSSKDHREIYDTFIELCLPSPFADLVGAGVLIRLGRGKDIITFSHIVEQLQQEPPIYETISKGTRTLMYDEKIGHMQINFEDDMDEGGFISNFLPYAILSQLCRYPVGLVDNEEYDILAFHLSMMYTVGSNALILRRADARSLTNMKPLEQFDLNGIGQLVSGREGVVEPFVQSLQQCFLDIPNYIEKLWERAFEETNFPLLWRIYIGLRDMFTITDSEIAEKAKKYVRALNEFFRVFMADYLSKDIENAEERERIRSKLMQFKAEVDDLD
jgi:hypothetical protein